jgi:hypothetical protein
MDFDLCRLVFGAGVVRRERQKVEHEHGAVPARRDERQVVGVGREAEKPIVSQSVGQRAIEEHLSLRVERPLLGDLHVEDAALKHELVGADLLDGPAGYALRIDVVPGVSGGKVMVLPTDGNVSALNISAGISSSITSVCSARAA